MDSVLTSYQSSSSTGKRMFQILQLYLANFIFAVRIFAAASLIDYMHKAFYNLISNLLCNC